MQKYQYHVFICINRRAEDNPKGCCARKASEEILSTFKETLAKKGLRGKVRANKAGCLDACALGPSVVIYPEGIWYTLKDKKDVNEVIEEHLVNGKIVERLLMPTSWAKG